jgi:hypothetical protein
MADIADALHGAIDANNTTRFCLIFDELLQRNGLTMEDATKAGEAAGAVPVEEGPSGLGAVTAFLSEHRIIHSLALSSSPSIVESLSGVPIDWNARDDRGRTPIMVAAARRSSEAEDQAALLHALLQVPCVDVCAASGDNRRWSAPCFALKATAPVDTLELLLEAGGEVLLQQRAARGFTVAAHALFLGSLDVPTVQKLFIDRGVMVDAVTSSGRSLAQLARDAGARGTSTRADESKGTVASRAKAVAKRLDEVAKAQSSAASAFNKALADAGAVSLVRLAPDSTVAKEASLQRADAVAPVSVAASPSKRGKAAAKAIRSLLRECPKSVAAHLALAEVSTLSGQLEDAWDALSSAVLVAGAVNHVAIRDSPILAELRTRDTSRFDDLLARGAAQLPPCARVRVDWRTCDWCSKRAPKGARVALRNGNKPWYCKPCAIRVLKHLGFDANGKKVASVSGEGGGGGGAGGGGADARDPSGCDMDIANLLDSLDMAKYKAAFAANEIDMLALAQLNEEDIRELGVKAVGPRRKLLKYVDAMKDAASQTSTFSFSDVMSHALAEDNRPPSGYVPPTKQRWSAGSEYGELTTKPAHAPSSSALYETTTSAMQSNPPTSPIYTPPAPPPGEAVGESVDDAYSDLALKPAQVYGAAIPEEDGPLSAVEAAQRLPAFNAALDRGGAEAVLATEPAGSFALRPARAPNALTLSHSKGNGAVGHCILICQQGRWSVESTPDKSFESIQEILESMGLQMKK